MPDSPQSWGEEGQWGIWFNMKKILIIAVLVIAYLLLNFAAMDYITSYNYMLPLFKSSETYQMAQSYQNKWNVPVWVGEFVWETQTPENPLLLPATVWTRFTDFRYMADDSMAKIVNNESGWSWGYWEYEKVSFSDEKMDAVFSKYINGSWRPSDPIPKLVVRGKDIQTEDGKTVILKGVNLPLKNLAMYSVLDANEDTFKKLDDIGVNVIRLQIDMADLQPKEGVWNQQALDTLKKAIDLAEEHHIYVIVNIHNYRCDGFPSWYGNRYSNPGHDCGNFNYMWENRQHPYEDSWDFVVSGWAQIINITKGRNIVAGYDLFNEPGATKNGVELYEYIAGKIELLDPGKINFVETPFVFHGMTSDEKPKIDNLVLSPHFYTGVWEGNLWMVMFVTSTLLPIIVLIILIAIEVLSYLRRKNDRK